MSLITRIGFSEDLFGNGKTVLRGGFGTFFERLQGNDIYNAATNPPFAYNLSLNNATFSSAGSNWVTGTSVASGRGVPVFAAALTNLAKNYAPPAVAQFSLGVQHEIKPSLIWVVQYVGNIAWHQNVIRHLNSFPLSTDPAIRCDSGDTGGKYAGDGGCSSLPNANIYRSYQGYGDISQEENTTSGNYNGFQTGLRVQNRWGLSGELDYTYSHEIDVTSNDLDPVSNPWNLKYDKGSGNLDRRQIVNANYVYKIPFFAKSNNLLHSVAGGWEVAGTFIDETGIPGNGGTNYQGPSLSIPYDSIGLGYLTNNQSYTNRPNVSGKVTYSRKQGQYFDTSKFSAPVPAWMGGPNQGFGNAAKDAIVGPGRVNFTTSLYRWFALTERAHVELRIESFNTFNHFEFNNVQTTLGMGLPKGASSATASTLVPNNNFGAVTSAWDPRVLELGGKFVF